MNTLLTVTRRSNQITLCFVLTTNQEYDGHFTATSIEEIFFLFERELLFGNTKIRFFLSFFNVCRRPVHEVRRYPSLFSDFHQILLE